MAVEFSKLVIMRIKLLFNFGMLSFLYVSGTFGQGLPCGIGAFLAVTHRVEGDRLQILGVASNSPAARAGLVPNQIILTVDGVSTSGLKFIDCVKLIQVEAGTKLVLEVAA